jgi:hypothetical protein
MRRLWLGLSLLACTRVEVDLVGRPCEDGRCAPGYVCHPETLLCVHELQVSCVEPGGICPGDISEGTACAHPGTFITCDEDYPPCERGCRTCGADGAWSACSLPQCQLGRTESCAACNDDCRGVIQNAFAVCDGAVCSYAGDCDPGAHDLDRNTANGCECLEDGVEVCDGFDNDCDGTPDNGDADCSGETPFCTGGRCVCDATSCGSGQWCEDGICRACADDDPAHCGVGCDVCALTAPLCNQGACACSGASCGTARWCDDNGGCQDCADGDALHCGPGCAVCEGEQPSCSNGACVCTASSCPAGEYCRADGTCGACDTAAACGSDCLPCGPGLTECNNGVCECATGSCPDGQYCTAAGCVDCGCPALFPSCDDLGGRPGCKCTSTSCAPGGTCDTASTRCRWVDSFDGSTTMFACSGDINGSWGHGVASGFSTCRSGSCWATSLAGNYNACEASCIRTPSYDLTGVTGEAHVWFYAAYDFETAFDGATVRFRPSGSASGTFVTPENGWDTQRLDLSGCSWADPAWPGWGQYGNSAGRPWERKHFSFTSGARPDLFHDDFFMRVYMLSDSLEQDTGIYIDDLEITVTQTQ